MRGPSITQADPMAATEDQSRHHDADFRALVVIPTLGVRLDTLERTLASVQSQADVGVNVVIVSKTASRELSILADLYSASITVHPGNISAAINAGFSQATPMHRYVAWLGDDDMLRPKALARTSALLERTPGAVVCFGTCDYIDVKGTVLFSRRPPMMAPMLLQFVPGMIKQETCLFRLDAVRRAGGLDENLKFAMDLDLLLRLRRLGTFVRANQIVAAFCWHPGSLTISNRKASLLEAQDVQRRLAQGVSGTLQLLLMYPIRYLILALSWKINRGIKVPRTEGQP